MPARRTTGGGIELNFYAAPGLYQFSVIADARQFDWDELYLRLHKFGNTGQRTGPWDFNLLDANKPLVPSYWVFLDGRKLGLWYFQRVSVEDIEHRRFRGRVAFHVPRAGRHTLRLEAYRPMKLRWMSALLEPDPEDRLEPPSFPTTKGRRQLPAAIWADETQRRRMRARLSTSHAVFAKPLCAAFDWVCGKTEHAADHLPLLIAAHHLGQRKGALAMALAAVDRAVALPHWGNPKPDGYGHNGDMGAAFSFRSLAHALHALRDELGNERRQRLIAKLTLQGNRFFDNALLNRDYWGGSVLQDHGWRSTFSFGDAALHLLGIIPDAARWVSYAIPRARRSLEAMPRDGVIPPSSYGSLYLYLDDLTGYRDALVALGGDDIFKQSQFRPIVDWVITALREREHTLFMAGAEGAPLIGGSSFLNRIASLHGDGRAAYLQRLLVETKASGFYHPTQEYGFFIGALNGFLSYDPGVRPVKRLPAPKRLTFFEDSGLAHYRDDRQGVTLSVRCGPWCGYNAYRRAQGSCDRMGLAPGDGHFIVALGSQPLLVTPDGGYRLQSALRSCLLVDGQGQRDDLGYPMSIPSKLHHGEEIEFARWDEKSGTGMIRLKLAPAYPESLGVAHYTRDFLVGDRRRIVCRDQIALNRPRKLSWLFQGKREFGVQLDGKLRGRFGKTSRLWVKADAPGIRLKVSVQQTPVVWSYASASGFKPFDHVRFDTVQRVATATVDFVITW